MLFKEELLYSERDDHRIVNSSFVVMVLVQKIMAYQQYYMYMYISA